MLTKALKQKTANPAYGLGNTIPSLACRKNPTHPMAGGIATFRRVGVVKMRASITLSEAHGNRRWAHTLLIHSFITEIYIAPLQGYYSEALPTLARLKRRVLRLE